MSVCPDPTGPGGVRTRTGRRMRPGRGEHREAGIPGHNIDRRKLPQPVRDRPGYLRGAGLPDHRLRETGALRDRGLPDTEAAVEIPRPCSTSSAPGLMPELVRGQDLADLFTRFTRCAWRFETQLTYAEDYEQAELRRFLAGEPLDVSYLAGWLDLVWARYRGREAVPAGTGDH